MDDYSPASPVYEYSPISQRYGGRDTCPTGPPTNIAVAPTDALCKVDR